MSDWYLVYCKPRQEVSAAAGLAEQGYEVYLPKVRVRKRRSSGMTEVEEPLFPRYLFVATATETQSIRPVQSTRGVQNLVRFGNSLLPVRADIVAALRDREDPQSGLHRLELPGLAAGDSVRIKHGAFAGLEGVFQSRAGEERVVVLLEILGQFAEATLPIEELER